MLKNDIKVTINNKETSFEDIKNNKLPKKIIQASIIIERDYIEKKPINDEAYNIDKKIIQYLLQHHIKSAADFSKISFYECSTLLNKDLHLVICEPIKCTRFQKWFHKILFKLHLVPQYGEFE